MTKSSRFADGPIGPLAYFPTQDPNDALGFLHSCRLTGNSGEKAELTSGFSEANRHLAPHFDILGSSAQLYPPSRLTTPVLSPLPWHKRRAQQQWLLDTHPVACMGNTAIRGLLKEDMQHFSRVEETANRRPLLCMGSMTDLATGPPRGMIPLLAAVTGPSGEELRLTRIDKSQWQWGDDDDAMLHLSVADLDKEEEAVWRGNAMPITQVKAISFVTAHNTYRWLLVQKSASTMILEPEHHPVPVADDSTHKRLSYIKPNLLVTLDNCQTGGNAYSDVCLNPPALDRHPQLVVIDECGYWTVLNILGTSQADRSTIRLSPFQCGHIKHGLLDILPSCPAYPAEQHGVLHLHIETLKNDHELDFTTPSRYVLLWNAQGCQMLDLESNTLLPRPDLFSLESRRSDEILDVQRSIVNKAQLFILTTHRLVWLKLVDAEVVMERVPKMEIILSVPHVGIQHGDTRVSVARACQDDPYTSLIFTYSAGTEQLCVYWFGFSPIGGLPLWHRHVTQFPGVKEKPSGGNVQQLFVQPAKLVASPKCNSVGPGSAYLQNDVQFYQVSMLGEDLSVRYCVCTASTNPGLEVTLPTCRIGWSLGRRQRWKHKRKLFLQRMTDAFVLPDTIDDGSMSSLLLRWTDVKEEPKPSEEEHTASPPNGARPISLKMQRISTAIGELLDLAVSQGEPGPATAVLEAVCGVLRDGQVAGQLPLMTADIADGLQQSTALKSAADVEIAEIVERLLDMRDDETVVTRLRQHGAREPSTSMLDLASVKQQLSWLWLEPTADKFSQEIQRIRQGWVREIAWDVFLSSHGVMVQDVLLFGPHDSVAQKKTESIELSSQMPRIQSSSPVTQPPEAGSAPLDGACRRLKLLAPSLNAEQLGTVKTPKLLSYWPEERGVGTDNYQSSVKLAEEEKFRGAKERLQRKIARRQAFMDKYKRPAFTREAASVSTGLGHVMSSPPPALASSQVLGPRVTMSQPTTGPYGHRKAKKAKRISGFRQILDFNLGGRAKRSMFVVVVVVSSHVVIHTYQEAVMSHCHDEHHSHDHDHDHSDDITPALQSSLYEQIDFDQITTLNEATRDAGKAVVKKTWAERMNPDPELVSDTDEQLLMTVPFTEQIKLHSVLIRTSASSAAPRTLHLYVNQPQLDFTGAEETEPTQRLELAQTSEVQDVPVRRALFGKVTHLGLLVLDNFGGDDDDEVSRISYLGFRGEWTRLGRAPEQIIYEAAPQPGDHRIRGTGLNSTVDRFVMLTTTTTISPVYKIRIDPDFFFFFSVSSTAVLGSPCESQPAMTCRLPTRVAVVRPSCRESVLIPRRHASIRGWAAIKPRLEQQHFNESHPGLPKLTTGHDAALKRKENSTPLRTGVIATKTGMTSLFRGGERVPCTVLQLDKVQVVANKTRDRHGYWAVQMGCGSRAAHNLTRPLLGLYEAKGIAPKKELIEFKVRNEEGLMPVGVQLQPDWFKLGQYVDVRGRSRGFGFAGGMKRHGFKGQGKSHGNSKNHRTMGSVGPSQGSGSRVHPGKKMPGRMGNEFVTVQNLKVLDVDNELGVVVVGGCVPGPKGRTVTLQDAKKRKPPGRPHREKALATIMERHPDAAQRLDTARKRHLEMKALRLAHLAV
ncbi:hypothetical protein L249_3274 [Ophiocordyceps polyrhachis-furcata BCC 54312]|uniref:Large ribosomal subunit protein uL3m n=1 Tax=Ophiocordyceps polyrhachis-furcata BCC 54312 TaxID=1330021 RepID=A0A367LQ26_9HYPO|nr:hypothetical protein L249_3274 [Ophiocordyceps polyrhachis-furcata BCC 54312]